MVNDILEKCYGDLSLFRGTKEGFKEELRKFLSMAYLSGVQKNILFFARRHHKNSLRKKVDFDNDFKKFLQDVDDWGAANVRFWRRFVANYDYFYKDVPRR
jgi:hypothetical protein